MANQQSENFWAHIEVIRRYQAPILLPGPDGRPYVADTAGPLMMVLRCECGYEWEIRKDEFQGRRKLKSCGRPECPYTAGNGPTRYRERGSTCSVYLTTGLQAQVAAFAEKRGVSFSRALEWLAREAMPSELTDSTGVTNTQSAPAAAQEPA